MKLNIFYLLSLLISICSCLSNVIDKKEREKLDSIKYTANSINSTQLTQNKNISSNDSLLELNDFDKSYSSSSRIHFDKNEVKWEEKEKNEFRFVFRRKTNKLIVYKNIIEFKIYNNPKIYSNQTAYDKGLNFANLRMIYVDGNKILNEGLLEGYIYSLNGLNKHSDYYIITNSSELLNKINSRN